MARAYDSAARIRGAQQTRASIVETARELLLHDGYAGMTVASLAGAAGVSPQTVYNSIGNKAAVVKAVYDQVMAGDDDARAMSERPGFQAIFDAADRTAFAHAYAGWIRALASRAGPLLGALLAHGTDAALLDFTATIERERYVGTTHAITGLRDRIGLPERCAEPHDLDRLIDAVWTLSSPDCYDRLVRRRGWSPAEYEAWLAGQLIALIG